MIGPIIDSCPITRHRLYFEPNGEFPGHEPNPLLEENRKLIIDTVLDRGRRARDRVGRRRRPLLLHRRPGRVRARRLPHRAAGRVDAQPRSPGRPSSTTSAPAGRWRDTIEANGGRALMNRVGHAFFKTRMREENAAFGGEVSGHYYFRDFWNADSGVIPALLVLELLSMRGKTDVGAAGALPQQLLHLGRDQLRGRRPGRQDGGTAERYSDGRQTLARRPLGRLRQLALQRAPVEHRAAAAAEPGGLDASEEMEARTDEVLQVIRA